MAELVEPPAELDYLPEMPVEQLALPVQRQPEPVGQPVGLAGLSVEMPVERLALPVQRQPEPD